MLNKLKKKFVIGIIIVISISVFVAFQQNELDKIDHTKEKLNSQLKNEISDKIIFWDETRPLTYDDFQGNIDRNAENDIVTASMIGFWLPPTFNLIMTNNEICQYEIKNYTVLADFDKSQSWVNLERVKQTNAYVENLNHEQRHFDIAEIYSRILMNVINGEFKDKKFICPHVDDADLKSVTDHDARTKISPLEKMIDAEYQKTQSVYENETGYPEFFEQQKKWDAKIDECLAMDLNEIHQCLHLYSK